VPDQLFGTDVPIIQSMTHIGERHTVDTVIRVSTDRQYQTRASHELFIQLHG
jgi:hypothetical protein